MSDKSSEKNNVLSLDRAYSFRLDGDIEEAVRIAGSILVANEDLGAAYLLSRILVEEQRPKLVAEVVASLVDRNIRRGNLPAACLAARVGVEAGTNGSSLFSAIAEAFGKGSPRVGDVAPRPPAFPVEGEVAPYFAKLSGAGLLDAAERSLKHFFEKKDSVPADTTLPQLPLYGVLEPETLRKLLLIQEVRELKQGDKAIAQGEEGQEAFTVARVSTALYPTTKRWEFSFLLEPTPISAIG